MNDWRLTIGAGDLTLIFQPISFFYRNKKYFYKNKTPNQLFSSSSSEIKKKKKNLCIHTLPSELVASSGFSIPSFSGESKTGLCHQSK